MQGGARRRIHLREEKRIRWDEAQERNFTVKLMEEWQRITAELREKLPAKAIPIKGV